MDNIPKGYSSEGEITGGLPEREAVKICMTLWLKGYKCGDCEFCNQE